MRMAGPDPMLAVALHRLTQTPLSLCQEVLSRAGGDFWAVVRDLRLSQFGSPSDAEVAAVLTALGIDDVRRV